MNPRLDESSHQHTRLNTQNSLLLVRKQAEKKT